VVKKPKMSLGALNTILNTAPLIIQGATRLVKMIRERETGDLPHYDIPETLEGLKEEIRRINTRLDAGNDSDLEQVNLIEELAKQNEMLATALKRTNKQLNFITIILVITLILAAFLGIIMLVD
jgi:hypothetical protein